jgi:hypothetical protein
MVAMPKEVRPFTPAERVIELSAGQTPPGEERLLEYANAMLRTGRAPNYELAFTAACSALREDFEAYMAKQFRPSFAGW